MDKKIDLTKIGITGNVKIFRNLKTDELVKKAIKRAEGTIAKNGSLRVLTGKTGSGRSPNDRFIVESNSVKPHIEWGQTNKPISEKKFDYLYKKVTKYLSEKDELFVFDGLVGANRKYSLKLRVVGELFSQALACKNLFINLTEQELKKFENDFLVLAAPLLKANPEKDGTRSNVFIILNLEKKIILIGGSKYTGEIKKGMFTVMNYLMPFKNVFPMHCSANMDEKGNTSLFFGLSGTGKTTLSADETKILIGDDEHGWCDDGIFNFEGGCYAKCINLKKEKEPQIWNAIKHGALVENVVMNKKKEYDYDNASFTENTRAAYPLNHIPNMQKNGIGNTPKTIIFLTADAFGVMPFIARLSKEQALYFFVTGYTSKLAGTEIGINEPIPTFSAFFGEPFMTRKHATYVNAMKEKLEKFETKVFMINTGWGGGPAGGKGKRIDIDYSRAMVEAATTGKLDSVEYKKHKIFGLNIPLTCPKVPSEILNPVNSWNDKQEYEKNAKKLAKLFEENFKKLKNIPKEVGEAGIKT